jgi:hypothetical protein
MLGSSWVAVQLAASQEGLSSMELLSYLFFYEMAHKELPFVAATDTKGRFPVLRSKSRNIYKQDAAILR